MSDPPKVNPLLFSASSNVSFDISTSAVLVPPSQEEDNKSNAGETNSQEPDGSSNQDVKTISGWFLGDRSDADPFSEIGGGPSMDSQELSSAAAHLLAPEAAMSSSQGVSPSSSMQCLSSSSSYQRLSPSSSTQTLPPSSSPSLPPTSSLSSPALPPSSVPHPQNVSPALTPSVSPGPPPSSITHPQNVSPALTPSISPAPPSSMPPVVPPAAPPAFTPAFPPPPPNTSSVFSSGLETFGPQRYQVPPPVPPLPFGQAPVSSPLSMEPPVRPPDLTPLSSSASASGAQLPMAPPVYQGSGHLRRPNAKYVVPPGQGSVRQTTTPFQAPPLPSQNKQQILPPFSASQLTNQPFIRPPVEAAQPTYPHSLGGHSHVEGYSMSASSGTALTYPSVPVPAPNSSVASISSVVSGGSHEEAPAAAIVPTSPADPAPSYATVIPSSFENMASKGAPHSMYHPVVPHWFYAEGSPPQWRPFSFNDSLNLEQSYRQDSKELVPTDGGRYDVNISDRSRMSVYWDENCTPVRRCSWFRKGQLEARPIPFEEDVSDLLENEFRIAMQTGVWHKQVELKTGDTIMIHSATSMFYYPLNNLTDFPSGVSVNDASTPMYVKRGMDDFIIEDGEDEQIDHLLFLVHGIGSVCDLRFRAVEECVNDFRKLGDQLLATNFSRVKDQGLVGRVELLPISWHKALHGDATGIDERLKPITLRSIPKLREFTNDTLLDILFFTSPVYCQHILNTVASEMNRLYNLFCKRNPSFTGHVSLGGHSLGSVILFDLLMNQPTSESEMDKEENESSTPESKENINTLEELLSHLKLEELSETFEKEQIDLEALKTFTNEELGQLDLEKGQIEKLCNFLNKIGGNCSAIEPSSIRLRERENSNTSQVDYVVGVAGTGQLSVVYPTICFKPDAFFLLGSPVAMFVTVRGISCLDQSFKLPTCDRVFNIFHPYDPVAYRLETLINPGLTDLRAELIPHHKGRKRMHLEIKETIGRVGSDIKQLVLDTVSSTWNSLYSKLYGGSQRELEQQVSEAIEQKMGQVEEEDESCHSHSKNHPPIGQLNNGRRIDYVLQEKPYETFNEYIFALQAHVSYWESEDTMLMMLKELYRPWDTLCDAEMIDSVDSKEPRSLSSPVLSTQYIPVASERNEDIPTFNPDLAESSSGASVPLISPASAGGCPVPTINLPVSNQSFPISGGFPNVSNPALPPSNAKVIGGRPVADITTQPMGMDPTAPPTDAAKVGPPPSLPVGKFNRKPPRR
ncbi:triacylglycerol hydrolase DDHD2-like isoform X1 [Oratosquilla oratoria]|uniref:triacylglycerol hydrolase DDHD2-like isoform X1 n=1 Tax=Oratosquilla oratoria TaxID=337810 RepID=UPI003F77247B